MIQTIAKFVSVGVINTLIDFVIFNLLAGKRVGWSKIKANTVSTTIAMVFSFFANKLAVFQSQGGNVYVQALEFFVVTAFGLYVLQNLVIHFFTAVWLWPARFANQIVDLLRLRRFLSEDFVTRNFAKVIATVVSLTWNFLIYNYVVFKA